MDYLIESKRQTKVNTANSISTNDDEFDTEEDELFDEEDEEMTSSVSSIHSNHKIETCKSAAQRRKQVKPIRILNEVKNESVQNVQVKSLPCGFCQMTCEDINILKNHLYKDHIEEILNFLVAQTQPKSQLNPQKLETFCTICKKEVCNKYFLKSHLLNKHGVQLEDYLANQTSSEPTAPSSQAALYAAAVANELIENHAQNLSLSTLTQVLNQKYSQNSQFSPNNFDYFLNTTSKLIDENKVQETKDDQTNLLNQYLSLALQNTETPSPQTTSSTSCDLCQKQFCNKYYLKKHKLDVHGLDSSVAPTTTTTTPAVVTKSSHSIESVQAAATLSMLINPLLLFNNTPAASNDSFKSASPSVKEEQEEKIEETMTEDKIDEIEQKPELKCDICFKFFKSSDFLQLHKMSKHKLKPLSDVQSNVLSSESFCEYCNKSFCNKYFLRTHMSKAHGKTLIIESTQNNSGVQDGHDEETFFASKVVDRVQCDICQKQVCNKYFLRTHKQKVHGIYDSELSQNEENEAGEIISSKRRDSDNCSDGESNLSIDSNPEILPSPPSTSASPTTTPAIDNQNSFCNLCKRKFYSYNFLRHHMNKIHHIKLPKRSFNQTDQENENIDEELEAKPKPDVSMRPKNIVMKKLNRLPLTNSLINLVNNLKCRMCMKEFKNKALMKQHVLTYHKIKYSDYLTRCGSVEQSNTSLARSILLNNLFGLHSSPSKANFKFKNRKVVETGRKRKNSTADSTGHSSIESSASKKSRHSDELEQVTNMLDKCKSLYSNSENLQAFMIERDETEDKFEANFMPCLVYLPVKGKINDQISVRIKLKPVDVKQEAS